MFLVEQFVIPDNIITEIIIDSKGFKVEKL